MAEPERKRERAREQRIERRDPRQPPPLLPLKTLLPPPGNALLSSAAIACYSDTIVAAVLVTGCGVGDHRNHHRSYRYFSSAVRPCLGSSYGS
ncbi:uncharacterized protein LOC110270948 isoform X2 [Arachis ipaensis]|uniref:uncharacterized protein LOC110270948 isoform X2 n=1 Tax=Arachis ipaensis TaxID=130454 RepID=UPI000A2B4C05|nr:uncharacterized protein LOC110270948 isoform X2 [Arachis ipaensis]